MKRILFTLLMLIVFSVSASAQLHVYRGYAFAVREVPYQWSSWEKSNVTIYFDFDKSYLYIDSKYPQKYYIVEIAETYQSPTEVQISYFFRDETNDVGCARFWKSSDGTYIMYIEYANIEWRYLIKVVNKR